MKHIIVICVLLLLAALAHQAESKVSVGKVKKSCDADESKTVSGATCYRFLCDSRTKQYTLETCDDLSIHCGVGKQVKMDEGNQTDIYYPFCCPRPYCE